MSVDKKRNEPGTSARHLEPHYEDSNINIIATDNSSLERDLNSNEH